MSALASFTGKREAEKWHMGKGGRELQGQDAPQPPPKRCLLLCAQGLAEGGKGEKRKPDARDNGLAMIQQQRRSIFFLSPETTWPGGAVGRGSRAEGRSLGGCHAHVTQVAQCCRLKKSLEPVAAMMTHTQF